MRRNEFRITDNHEINDFLLKQQIGIFSVIDEKGYPYSIPVNYIYMNDKIYFHGAKKGKKIQCIQNNIKSFFSVYEAFSFIPTYFLGLDESCTASQFYKSVMMRGTVEFIDVQDEKIKVLDAFMNKYQFEGSQLNTVRNYNTKVLENTEIIIFSPEEITAKFKFGQHLAEEEWKKIKEGLEKRNDPIDIRTIDMMIRYRELKSI